jgi:hypothetical protein
MNAPEISRLLEKYYNGQSSEEEELILRDYFQGENIPDEYSAEKEIFQHYNQPVIYTEPSEGFAQKIISAIDSEEAKEKSFRFTRRGIMTFSGIAAGLLMMVGAYFFFNAYNEPKDTFASPDIAYAEAVKILYEVSSQINHGTDQLNNIRKMDDVTAKSFAALNRSTAIIDKNLKNLNYFEQAINIISSPLDYIKNK